VYRQSARGRLPLLSARPAVTFPAAEHHRPLAGTKFYCLVTEAHSCEQLAALPRVGFEPGNLPIASPTLYPLHYRTYRWIKLSEHAMKVVERIFEHRIRQQIKVDDMQFGFMKAKETTNAIFSEQ